MMHPLTPAILVALSSPGMAAMRSGQSMHYQVDAVQIALVSIHRRVIVRVPRLSRIPARMPSQAIKSRVEWKEHKGPKCVAVGEIAGAMLNNEGAIDLLMDSGERLRARLDGDCKPLDYYSRFYLRPDAGGLICRQRNAIRMRSGARCEIDTFKILRAKK